MRAAAPRARRLSPRRSGRGLQPLADLRLHARLGQPGARVAQDQLGRRRVAEGDRRVVEDAVGRHRRVPCQPGLDAGVALAQRRAAEVAVAEVAEQVADLRRPSARSASWSAPPRDVVVRRRAARAGCRTSRTRRAARRRSRRAAVHGARLVVRAAGMGDTAEIEEDDAHGRIQYRFTLGYAAMAASAVMRCAKPVTPIPMDDSLADPHPRLLPVALYLARRARSKLRRCRATNSLRATSSARTCRRR